MKSKFAVALAAGLLVSGGVAGSASADLLAYWDQNSNALPNNPAVFGFVTTAFPQAADQGSGALSLADFDTTTSVDGVGGDVYYTYIPSFSGTTVNAQPAIASGGSISPQGGASDGNGGFTNNGMSIILDVSTLGAQDIIVSWAQRGTSTGFNSREFSYSTDGGATYVSFDTNLGALSSTYTTVSYDLSAISALDNLSSALFKITLNGATSSTGNNRFDNITVEGTLVPEPASLALLGLGAWVMTRRK